MRIVRQSVRSPAVAPRRRVIEGAVGALGPLFASCAMAAAAASDDSATELAKKLANPVANLISVPFQYNHDDDIGPSNGSKDYLNIQPVIPIGLNADWNLITRTIMPLIDLHDLPRPGDSKSGLGDITASQFFSPKAPTSSGWIWGAGPVELLPTASSRELGGGKWGLGPTFVALKQEGPITYGVLANHIWSVAGDSDRANISSTFLQPFLAYVTKTHTTFGLNTESTYDWRTDNWSVPINITVAQMLKLGPQIFQVTLGARYWATAPDSGPEGWGWRLVVTLLYPK